MEVASAQPDLVDSILRVIIAAIELLGVAVIVAAAIVATVNYLKGGLGSGTWAAYFQSYRSTLGRGILLGLEFLIAADILRTVTLSPTLDSLLVLAGIVLVRTFLSLSLEVEIEGRWPWQPAKGDN
jgi:uncharacterized membrane protein